MQKERVLPLRLNIGYKASLKLNIGRTMPLRFPFTIAEDSSVLAVISQQLGVRSHVPVLLKQENLTLTVSAQRLGIRSHVPVLLKQEQGVLALTTQRLGITAHTPVLAKVENLTLALTTQRLGVRSNVPTLLKQEQGTVTATRQRLAVKVNIPALVKVENLTLSLTSQRLAVKSYTPTLQKVENLTLTATSHRMGIRSNAPVLLSSSALTVTTHRMAITEHAPVLQKVENLTLSLTGQRLGIRSNTPTLLNQSVQTNFYVEAESGTMGANWEARSDDADASGQYILTTTGTTTAPTDAIDEVAFALNNLEAGTYDVWLRIKHHGSTQDSFFVQMNADAWITCNGLSNTVPSGIWYWQKVWASGDTSTPVTFTLTAGNHTFKLGRREAGTKIDRMYVTKMGDRPTGAEGVGYDEIGTTLDVY